MTLPTVWQLIEIMSEICLAGAALGSVYALTAAVAVARFKRGDGVAPVAAEPVSILKPLHGPEPGLLRRLAATCEQDYAAPIQLVCGVQDGADPAAAAVEALAGCTEAVDLVVDARRRGTNPKISNLANMLPKARHDLLLIADSDVEVGPDYLRKITAELQKPGVGAVSCLYYGVPASRTWGRLSALGINSHFLPNVVLALQFGMAEPCFGTTIAMRRSLLHRIGGFEAFGNVLADDYAVGQAVRSAGYRVGIPSFALGHACFERSLGALLAQDLRIARTIKTINPIGYYGLIITHPFPLALLGAMAGVGDALIVAAVALASRLLLCHCIERRFGLVRQDYWLVPVRDVLSFAAYLRGLFGSAVNWRGAIFRVGRTGRFVPAAQPEQVVST